MLEVKLASNRYLALFFRCFKPHAAAVKLNITHELPNIILHRPEQIKAAYQLTREGRVIYEYKIVLPQHICFRAAYTQNGRCITVFFISDILIKHEFVRRLAATNLVD
ncbi:hypothetical protein [Deefgea sp. CFH1-16]|uniref:hypothetical protein n=1 Tax=Deefgea sp. CFH1-16 TaxID=2675457 RepID=UPI0015F62521|nr:hypothetical protein [Deefgea sp. CFH1-16]MBM5574265.1 hypothetical protein [Deefgea sp. CFH1-16]